MSGRKNFLNSYKVVSAGNMASNITSAITNIQGEDNIGIQVNITSGTPTGTLAVQVSADYNQNLNTGNWSQITTQAITTGTPTPTYFDLNQLSAPWIRIVYTATSGTGNCDIFIVGKMI